LCLSYVPVKFRSADQIIADYQHLRSVGAEDNLTDSPSAISLFAGCGGFCEGVELAGFQIKVAVELDRYACETYRANFPKTPLFEGDIHDFLQDGSDHESRLGLSNGVDLIFGGPPCQGYSQIGPRDMADDRNGLYKEFARIVRRVRPSMFIMENVPNLVLMQKGHFKDAILEHFRSLGYSNIDFVKVSAADVGVPQTRERVLFYGTRDDLPLKGTLQEIVSTAFKALKVQKAVTVREAIGDLPEKVVHSGETAPYPAVKNPTAFQKAMRLDAASQLYSLAAKRRRAIGRSEPVLHNHHTKEMLARRARLISFLRPGQKADSLPKDIWNGKRPEKWRRLHPDLPSYTILAQMHRDLSEWVHPSLERWISVREAARLQSFHDGFIFKGSEWQQLKQIGNAVPPLLGYAAGKAALAILNAIEAGRRETKEAVKPVLPTAKAA
jgi:DNA (cytosine-5)-methyltransferase 1